MQCVYILSCNTELLSVTFAPKAEIFQTFHDYGNFVATHHYSYCVLAT